MKIWLGLGLLICACSASAEYSREGRELAGAERTILIALAPKITHSPTHIAVTDAGLYAANAEQAQALIGARGSSVSLQSLAGLLRYQSDGALSEDYGCYAAQYGKRFAPYLKHLNAQSLHTQCLTEVATLIKSYPTTYDEQAQTVCRASSDIRLAVAEALVATKHGRCADGDF